MTAAEVAWTTWRRILTGELQLDDEQNTGERLSPLEQHVVEDYRSTPVVTGLLTDMYRRGLVRNALGSLTLAPVAQRLLYTSGIDIRSTAADFCRAHGYPDHGPNFLRAADSFVRYVKDLAPFSAPTMQDAFQLELAAIDLLRSLADPTGVVWPDDVSPEPVSFESPGRLVATRAAVVVHTDHDMTTWLEDPAGFDPSIPVAVGRHHWLIYLPNPNASLGYADLSMRSATVFEDLTVPTTIFDLWSSGVVKTKDDLCAVINDLEALGVVTQEG